MTQFDKALFTEVTQMVEGERIKQEHQRLAGRFKDTLSSVAMLEGNKVACIAEELGEVSKIVLNRTGSVFNDTGEFDDHTLLRELVQVQALSAAWSELLIEKMLDKRRRMAA